MYQLIILILPLLSWAQSLKLTRQPQERAPLWIASGSHDPQCYTQGLSFFNETHLLQSCGQYERSYFQLLKYQQEGGLTSQAITFETRNFPDYIFLEGSVYFPKANAIYMLTWKENIVYRLDPTDYSEIDFEHRLFWASQGWGLTHNNTHMIVSDGNSSLFIVDESFEVLQELPILDENGEALEMINEIEWVEGEEEDYVYANLFLTKDIVKIGLTSQKVLKRWDMTALVKDSSSYYHYAPQDVLNGIAFQKQTGLFVLTGKHYRRYYVVHLDGKPQK